jgi:nucleoside recognition membrane protein YjiH
MVISHREKITILWIVFLLGLLFHTQLGLMPLFHNQSIAINHAHESGSIAWILWSMLAFFIIPMIAIVTILFTGSRLYRKLHFGVTIVYSILNVFHLLADLWVKPIAWYQIALMVWLLIIGFLLNLVSFEWMQKKSIKTH